MSQTKTYEPHKVLVTGGAGFIASHMVIKLLSDPSIKKVIVLDKLDYCSSLCSLAICMKDERFQFIKGDVNNYAQLVSLLQENSIDTVMHFAANTHVDKSFETSSTAFTYNNTLATHTLLEAVRQSKFIQRIIHVSTDEVYGETFLENPAFEDFPILPKNPYAATKANAEMLCLTYAQCYKVPVIITRGNNVYGPHQYPDKIIPKFVQHMINDENVPIHGDGKNFRSYLHVQDTIDAFFIILTRGTLHEIYNIGSDNYYSVLEVFEHVKTMFINVKQDAAKQIKCEFTPDRVYNDKTYCINCDKLKNLGWMEKVPFEKGLEDTIRWYVNILESPNNNNWWAQTSL